jgi:ribonuclease HI
MKTWTCYTDGGARGNPGPAGCGAYIISPEGHASEFSEFLGNGTNNMAEYAGVILALTELKKKLGKHTKEVRVEIRLDSELVKKQLSNEYQIKELSLVPAFIEIHNLHVSAFPHLSFVHVPREKNKDADRLANAAMDQGTSRLK